MAIIIHCPYCHQPLQEMRQECTLCNSTLPAGVVYALAAAFGTPQLPPSLPHVARSSNHPQEQPLVESGSGLELQPPAHDSPLRPWLAATLSIFCGLGQLYNGQIVKGIILMILATAALVSLSLHIGKLLALVVWSYAIIDAFLVARQTTGITSSRKS
jgi:TM2 domain-containing membrane protein YozV